MVTLPQPVKYVMMEAVDGPPAARPHENIFFFFPLLKLLFIDQPPDRLLHTKSSLYQSGIWSRCLEPQQNLPSPEDFGWKDSNRTPVK